MNWFNHLLSLHWSPNWTKGFPSSFSSFTSSYSWVCLSKFFRLTFFIIIISNDLSGKALSKPQTVGILPWFPMKHSSRQTMDKACFWKASQLSILFYFLKSIISRGKERPYRGDCGQQSLLSVRWITVDHKAVSLKRRPSVEPSHPHHTQEHVAKGHQESEQTWPSTFPHSPWGTLFLTQSFNYSLGSQASQIIYL